MTEYRLIMFVWCVIVINVCTNASPISMEKMIVSRKRMADLESSATGYVYNSQRGQPSSYVQYTNHGTGEYYEAPSPIQYVTYRKPEAILNSGPTLIAAYPEYNKEVAADPTGYVVPLVEAPKKAAIAPYYIYPKVLEGPQRVEIADDENNESSEEHDDDDDDNSEVDEDEGEEDEDDEQEEHGGGEESHSEGQSSHGDEGVEGYKHHHKFDNGQIGKHHKDNHEGHYSEEGGNKKSQSEAAGGYDQHHEVEKASEGENYGQQAYHKKGHKTSGFHNVYSKDEYKKDTDFYDDDHKSGHYDKYSSSDGHNSAAEGGYTNGHRHDSGHENSETGKSGHNDKSQDLSQRKGYKSKEGADSYHNHHTDYENNGGAVNSKKYGYGKK